MKICEENVEFKSKLYNLEVYQKRELCLGKKRIYRNRKKGVVKLLKYYEDELDFLVSFVVNRNY